MNFVDNSGATVPSYLYYGSETGFDETNRDVLPSAGAAGTAGRARFCRVRVRRDNVNVRLHGRLRPCQKLLPHGGETVDDDKQRGRPEGRRLGAACRCEPC